jgi:hypothetical protein
MTIVVILGDADFHYPKCGVCKRALSPGNRTPDSNLCVECYAPVKTAVEAHAVTHT